MIEEELEFAKSALKRAIGMLPENAMVGFVSYGTQVQVHELGFSEMSKVYVFRGSKDISKDQVLEQLGLASAGSRRAGPAMQKSGGGPSPVAGAGPNMGINRFLLPASECEYTLNSVMILCLLSGHQNFGLVFADRFLTVWNLKPGYC